MARSYLTWLSAQRRAKAAYERTAHRVTKAWSDFEEPYRFAYVVASGIWRSPATVCRIKVGALLGYADWVGVGDNYR